MTRTRLDGSALLIAGHGIDGTSLDASQIQTLGRIGEALLATGAAWKIRRVHAVVEGTDRASLKCSIDELATDDADVAVIVVLGAIVERQSGPALVAGAAYREYPDDATLPLAWIGDRLREARATRVCTVVSAHAENPRHAEWLAPLGSTRDDLVAVHAPGAAKSPLAEAMLDGLCGDALDPRTGTITTRSLADHFARVVPNVFVRTATDSVTIATSPPLDRMSRLWDVRRSQLAAARARAVSEDDDLAGTMLPGRFRIDEQIERGTFGTVYRAHQLTVERDVAIKVLNAGVDPSSDDGRLFVHEIRSVGRIDHPGVVRIYQADITHDGRLFFAMELLAGRDLHKIAGDGVVAPDRAIALVRKLLDGLAAAHDAGLVHADVKPANVIVVPFGDRERVVLVDFGLARLRPSRDATVASVGGTPAFMAPEQLDEGRVDARSDLFSAALVLVYLITGWRRTTATALAPPDETLAALPAHLRTVLARAFAIDPAARFPSATDFANALAGKPATTRAPIPRRLPFHHLEPLTERDTALYGRERDLAALLDRVLYGSSVIYTAPSGIGKTSLLRAGLVPRLTALGTRVEYYACRPDDDHAREIAKLRDGSRPVVAIIDQSEVALSTTALATLRGWTHRDATFILGVREDYLARALEQVPDVPVMRLPPLDATGARAAILGPIAEARLAIEPKLVDALLEDLQRKGPSIYPPHLQLACTVLCETLPPGETTIALAHYRALGGFDAIVGEYLERSLDELGAVRETVARDLFVALVSAENERAARTEADLLEIVGAKYPEAQVTSVLETLRERGLLHRARDGEGARWELAHDSLVPRVLAWLDRRDLARRRAVELVRYHLRHASLLGRRELREVKPHASAIAELDREWRARAREGMTPSQLVARSAQMLRRKVFAIAGTITIALAVGGVGLYRSRVAYEREVHEHSLRDRDMGRFTLTLEPFDWDATTRAPIAVATADLPDLAWSLHYADATDPDLVGDPFSANHFERDGDHVEARGGRAFLVATGRGRTGETCAPSVVRVHALPGYAQRGHEEHVRVPVPTCAASARDMVKIPAGRFIDGGAGDPPSPFFNEANAVYVQAEVVRDLPAFAIDRVEVSNASFGAFATKLTGIGTPSYPKSPGLDTAGGPDRPVGGVTWSEARAYCAYFGKRLPTTKQWTKALRGGETIDEAPNPHPRRITPWGDNHVPAELAVSEKSTTTNVGTTPVDRSPYGVLDLASNVEEWTSTLRNDVTDDGMRIIRGANKLDLGGLDLISFLSIENQRPAQARDFSLGFRCVSD